MHFLNTNVAMQSNLTHICSLFSDVHHLAGSWNDIKDKIIEKILSKIAKSTEHETETSTVAFLHKAQNSTFSCFPMPLCVPSSNFCFSTMPWTELWCGLSYHRHSHKARKNEGNNNFYWENREDPKIYPNHRWPAPHTSANTHSLASGRAKWNQK